MRPVHLAAVGIACAGSCVMLDPIVPDVAPHDGGTDAPVIRDAPRDALRPDAPAETDPAWAVPPGVPADCTVERAEHPERLPALAWEACGEGCSRADLGTIWNAVDGFRVDGQVWFELLSDDFGLGDTDALAPAEGPLLDAWRYETAGVAPACDMFWYAASEGRTMAMVAYFADDDARVMEERYWTYGLDARPWGAPADIAIAAPWVGSTRGTQEFVVTASLAAFRIAFGQVVVWYEGELREVFASTATQGGFDLGAAGDHVTFMEVGAERRLVHWTPARGTEVLYDPPEPLQDLRQDGTTLTWSRLMDFAGPVATRAELWTAELVEDPLLLAPRLVHDDVDPDGTLGGGVFAWPENTAAGTTVHLIDLDTGRHRILVSPPGHGCQILYVSRRDVALGCNTVPPSVRSIYRYDPDLRAMPAP
jgi:hypothetical protein